MRLEVEIGLKGRGEVEYDDLMSWSAVMDDTAIELRSFGAEMIQRRQQHYFQRN